MSPASTPARTLASPREAAARWDIFCRVIDNFGDVGVCWRLAADLADRGLQVRLMLDDSRALAWMAPQGHPSVQVLPWTEDHNEANPFAPADVVIEAFGCDPPAAYVRAMARQSWQEGHGGSSPFWLNLEYLSAEDYVERSHGLPSPQANGLTKWFFYPGFTSRTGGLLRECDLAARQAAFDRDRWLGIHHIHRRPGERLVSLFCYANPGLPALMQALAAQPTLVLLTPGAAQAAAPHAPPGLRVQSLPWLTQQHYDHLLWACDLNFVRGEDSLVRALWAGKPWVWQAYPQQGGVHHVKVQALLDRWQPSAEVQRLWRWWNGSAVLQAGGQPGGPGPVLPGLHPWQQSANAWRQQLLQQAPLAEQLLAFVHAKSCAGVKAAC